MSHQFGTTPGQSPTMSSINVPTANRLLEARAPVAMSVPDPNIRTFMPLMTGSPMPIVELPIRSSTGAGVTEAEARVVCLSTEDGNFGSEIGDQVNLFFFYQVEATPGTTETQMNGVILGDIEITLLDFMIQALVSECMPAALSSGRVGNTGEFVGLSAKPADFVLRGCESCIDVW